jgi:tRNA (guanine37-N1)-methyltransferase
MNFYILTLFPEMVSQGLDASILGRARQRQLISVETVNIRDYTEDKHKKVDDYPYGGGAGMVMQAQPIYGAWESVTSRIAGSVRTVYLTPQGRTFTQSDAKDFAKEENLILLCGHYEGVDERVLEEIVTDQISIGDFVLTGGELPAMVMVDAIARMVPGVLSNDASGETETFENHLLEYPQYSRPVEWRGRRVPDILLSGDHARVDQWRHRQSLLRTRDRRPDLLEKAALLQEDQDFLEQHPTE